MAEVGVVDVDHIESRHGPMDWKRVAGRPLREVEVLARCGDE